MSCKFLGWTNSVIVENQDRPGLSQHDAANNINRFGVFEFAWDQNNVGPAIQSVAAMVNTGNNNQLVKGAAVFPGGITEQHVKDGLQLLGVVQNAWSDHSITLQEGLSIFAAADKTATGQTALADALGGALTTISGLFGKKAK